jgi:hypothetical protein
MQETFLDGGEPRQISREDLELFRHYPGVGSVHRIRGTLKAVFFREDGTTNGLVYRSVSTAETSMECEWASDQKKAVGIENQWNPSREEAARRRLQGEFRRILTSPWGA